MLKRLSSGIGVQGTQNPPKVHPQTAVIWHRSTSTQNSLKVHNQTQWLVMRVNQLTVCTLWNSHGVGSSNLRMMFCVDRRSVREAGNSATTDRLLSPWQTAVRSFDSTNEVIGRRLAIRSVWAVRIVWSLNSLVGSDSWKKCLFFSLF